MARTLKHDIPGPDLRVDVEEAREKGWQALFEGAVDRPLRLVVELGFGRGEYLLHLAQEAPGVAHLGIELSHKRVVKMARRLARSETRNIRLIEGRAEEIVATALDDGTVSCFWVNFPDPWPKKRHHRRRLLQPDFLALLERKLAPGGSLEIATDHVGYAAFIDESLRAVPALENTLAPERFLREVPGRMHTAYETEWRRAGRALHFWRYRKRGSR